MMGSYKLPIPFPYFKGFLWEWYGSSMGVGVPLLGVPRISLDLTWPTFFVLIILGGILFPRSMKSPQNRFVSKTSIIMGWWDRGGSSWLKCFFCRKTPMKPFKLKNKIIYDFKIIIFSFKMWNLWWWCFFFTPLLGTLLGVHQFIFQKTPCPAYEKPGRTSMKCVDPWGLWVLSHSSKWLFGTKKKEMTPKRKGEFPGRFSTIFFQFAMDLQWIWIGSFCWELYLNWECFVDEPRDSRTCVVIVITTAL